MPAHAFEQVVTREVSRGRKGALVDLAQDRRFNVHRQESARGRARERERKREKGREKERENEKERERVSERVSE